MEISQSESGWVLANAVRTIFRFATIQQSLVFVLPMYPDFPVAGLLLIKAWDGSMVPHVEEIGRSEKAFGV